MTRILVVEDDDPLRTVIELLLLRKYELVTVENIQDALEAVKKDLFDLNLLDRNLPDGLGDELLYIIREELKSKAPVIMFSATMQDETIHTLMDLGANEYLVKPFDIRDLISIIDHWVEQDVAY
jgi:DNA-binding response OmpR family regulator